jgi:hypothetical protein
VKVKSPSCSNVGRAVAGTFADDSGKLSGYRIVEKLGRVPRKSYSQFAIVSVGLISRDLSVLPVEIRTPSHLP